MSLFIKLSDIGLNYISNFLDSVLLTFNTPVVNLLPVNNFVESIVNLLRPGTFLSKLQGLFGVINLQLPLWEYLLVNISLILSLTIFIRFVSFVFPF